MSAKKFEKLIDLIINEDQERAEQLFHEIVVEKSRQIYEGMMDQTGDETDDLMNEIESEESGMMEDEDEFDMGDDSEEEFDDEEFGDDEGMDDGLDMEDEEDFEDEEDMGDEGLEDRVVDLEDKLDQLMADFEAEMGNSDEEDMGMDDEEDMGDEDMDDEEDMGDEDMGDEEESGLMEAAQLTQVGGKTYDKFGKMGDSGAQTKSPGLANPKRIQTGGAPVKFAGDSESVPTSAKKPSNAYSKGEKEEDFGNINKVGGNAGKTAFKTKAPAPKTETVSSKSPVAETKRTAKRRI